MRTPEETLCFTCSLPLGDPPRLNHLPSGQVCPSCVERLLETLPPLLPARDSDPVAPAETEAAPERRKRASLARVPRKLAPPETDLPPSA